MYYETVVMLRVDLSWLDVDSSVLHVLAHVIATYAEDRRHGELVRGVGPNESSRKPLFVVWVVGWVSLPETAK
jgi:hypothetical protein